MHGAPPAPYCETVVEHVLMVMSQSNGISHCFRLCAVLGAPLEFNIGIEDANAHAHNKVPTASADNQYVAADITLCS
ncbi:hypothetical protein NM688_g1783 [Phlebia brevispora]|uniref:Uncharacterized protein n=1 Tax=Phlebia brevispora TaxID=194682 RepID=A0ACC1TAU8_9APHY|nr:hypothetical protein NM688_g1783 [Phlebia brevispora]